MKVKSTIYFIILLVILLLNEIYNYKNYNKKDSFSNGYDYDSEYNTNYKFDKTLDPIDYARKEFKSVIIPNVIDGNTHLKDGIACQVQKTILDEKMKSKKLDYQGAYVNALEDMIFPEHNSNDNTLEKLIKGDKVKLNFEDDLDPNVFNPIYKSDFTKDKKCPTVCHLLSSYSKCKNATDIPNFKNKTEFDAWRIDTIDKCSKITTKDSCESDNDCTFDYSSEKCYYDKRKCLAYLDSDKNLECHTRCDFLNVPNKEQSKMNCDSAKLFDGNKYCDWNKFKNECHSKCDMYIGENACIKSSNCKYVGGKCINS